MKASIKKALINIAAALLTLSYVFVVNQARATELVCNGRNMSEGYNVSKTISIHSGEIKTSNGFTYKISNVKEEINGFEIFAKSNGRSITIEKSQFGVWVMEVTENAESVFDAKHCTIDKA